jgi:hypothetical protein
MVPDVNVRTLPARRARWEWRISVGQLVGAFAVLRFPVESIGFPLDDLRHAHAVDRFEVMRRTRSSSGHPKTIAAPAGRLVSPTTRFRYSGSPSQYDDLLDGIELEPGETVAVTPAPASPHSPR